MPSIYDITAQTESGNRDFNEDGSWVTSPKGARGRMQVMPGTSTDPGFGVRPARDDSPAELARVGRDYLDAMRRRYNGDMAKAWAAYNAGPGKLDEVLGRYGDQWLDKMPSETRNYVARNLSQARQSDQVSTPSFTDPDFWEGGDSAARGQVASFTDPDFWEASPSSGGGGVGTEVIQSLFPKARVTSGYRGPDHPLSKKNPNSWHARSHGAVDVAPIPGMTFNEALSRIRSAGYNVIEAKNEVGSGRSKHATGDHWHFVIGDRSMPGEAPRQYNGPSFTDPGFWE